MQQSERSSALTHRSRSSTVPDAIVGDRRAKRSRTSQIPANSQDEDAEGRQDSDGILERTHKSRTRVVIACKTCRARKTKCDGGQPKCSFCTRINGVCEYDDPEFGHASCQILGPQILGAIQNLTDLVQDQQRPRSLDYRFDSFGLASSQPHDALVEEPSRAQCYQTGQCCIHPNSPGIFTATNASVESPEARRDSSPKKVALSEGLDSILKWRVFPRNIHTIPVDGEGDLAMTHTLPSIDYTELLRLEARYISVVHTKNPMLDLTLLRQRIAQIAESGLDWSISTCLVALVCAIGSVCNTFSADTTFHIDYSERKDNLETGLRYWSVASKRLGLAMSDNTIEAVQCMCLAGIWCMCNLQPLQAWKYFTMAGNSWYSATIARNTAMTASNDTQQKKSLTLEQSTFFTSYKSELEIRFELAVHGSILERLDYPFTFPLPPIFDADLPEDELPDNERTAWYFYLSEIAARHLINRILESRSTSEAEPSAREIQHMLKELEIFEAQLREWHQSLPPIMSFDIFDEFTTPSRNEFQHILRSRYMFISELCYRPFVKLCLNHTLDVSQELISKVAAVASHGLQLCVWRLRSVVPQYTRNHGLWFIVRNSASYSMILIAAARAQRNPLLNAVPYLQIPAGWREEISKVLDNLSLFANERRGGVMECIQMVQWALSDFAT